MSKDKIVFFRGPQGSGKSTAAKQFCARQRGLVHLESDDYFLDERGVYRFREEDHALARLECKRESKRWSDLGVTPVVSNTFPVRQEINEYLDVLGLCPDQAVVFTCHRGWSALKYAEKSIHSVPASVISALLARWEEWDGELEVGKAPTYLLRNR